MVASTSKFHMVSRSVIAELFELLSQGRHIAIVAPPQAGKALVLFELQRLARRVEGIDRPRVIVIRASQFRGDSPTAFVQRLADICQVDVPVVQDDGSDIAIGITQILCLFQDKDLSPAWFVVQNVTKFAGAYLRALLSAVQVLSETETVRDRLSVLITGSKDFVELTYADNSPYRHASRYFLTGWDRELTGYIFDKRLKHCCLQVGFGDENPPQCVTPEIIEMVHGETFGQLSLIDALAIRVRDELQREDVKNTETVKRLVEKGLDEVLFSSQDVVRFLADVESDRTAWDELLQLLKGDQTIRARNPLVPQTLETSGVATRRPCDRTLVLAPLWEKQLRVFLGTRRIADVYALQGRWDEAWKKYQGKHAADCYRPITGQTRAYLNNVLSKWRESIFDIDTLTDNQSETPAECQLVAHFAKGLQHLLGFVAGEFRKSDSQEVRHEYRDPDLSCGPIELIPLAEHRSRFHKATGIRISHDQSTMELRCPEDWAEKYYWILQRRPGTELSASGLKSLEECVNLFWRSYQFAQDRSREKHREKMRERHLQVVAEVTSLLARDADLGTVIRQTCEALRVTGGYFRSMICLVTPDGKRIQSVAGASAGTNPCDALPIADFALDREADPSKWEIQQHVVLTGQSCVLHDAKQDPKPGEPKRKQGQARRLRMDSIAVVPLKLVRGNGHPVEILGTIHLERPDKQPMDPIELESVEILAGHIATALDSVRKVELLQHAVDTHADEFRILGPLGRLLFQNRAARERSKSQADAWVYPLSTQPESIHKDIYPSIAVKAAREEKGPAHVYDQPDPEKPEQAWDEFAAPLYDFRKNLKGPASRHGLVGYVTTRHDLSDISKANRLFHTWIGKPDVQSATNAILDFMSQKEHEWCRIYLWQQNAVPGGALVSFAEYGITAPDVAKRFRSGAYKIAKSGGTGEVWDEIDWSSGPFVFRYQDQTMEAYQGRTPKQRRLKKRHSYEIHVSKDRWREDFGKTTREWIEAPLYSGEKLVGLVSVSMPKSLSPHLSEQMRLWFTNMAAAIDHARTREDYVRKSRNEAAEKVMKLAIHQLANKLGPPETRFRLAISALTRSPDPGTVKAQVESLKCGEKMLQLTRSILDDFKKYADDRPFKDVKRHDPYHLMESLIEHVKGTVVNETIDVSFSSIPPQSLQGWSVKASESALLEVAEILVRNSINHALVPDRKLALFISFDSTERPPWPTCPVTQFFRIRFSDNGSPIPEALRTQMFDAFVSTKDTGNGLGLPIARDFLTKQDGTIEYVETGDPNFPAAFELCLPLIPVEVPSRKQAVL